MINDNKRKRSHGFGFVLKNYNFINDNAQNGSRAWFYVFEESDNSAPKSPESFNYAQSNAPFVSRSPRLASPDARFITVSATIGNIDEFTEWLSRPNIDCINFQMADKNRMVDLKTIVIPYPRPQFDTSATAVILTSTDDEIQINKMLRMTSEMIESHLNIHLTEHFNAEISLHTIESISDIDIWIKNTFLYIRCKKNPTHYGFTINSRPDLIIKGLQDIVMVQLNRLCLSNMVLYNKDNYKIISTDIGHLMARYFINIETMEKIMTLSATQTLESMIEFLSNCAELSDLNLRYSERGVMNSLNRHRGPQKIRFPIKGRIISTSAKINCLIQVILGSQQIKDASLLQDSDRIFRVGNRILRCIHDYVFLLSSDSNNYSLLLNCTLLKKSFQIRLWENTWFISQQLIGIGPVLATYLTDAGLNTLNKLANADPKFIEQILHRNAPFGRKIVDCAAGFPKYELSVEQVRQLYDEHCMLELSVKKMSQRSDGNDCSEEFSKDCVILIIGDQDNNVLCKTRITNHQLSREAQFKKTIRVLKASTGPILYIDLISECYVGFDIRTEFEPGYSQVISKPPGKNPVNDIEKKSTNQKSTNQKRKISIPVTSINNVETNKGCDYKFRETYLPSQIIAIPEEQNRTLVCFDSGSRQQQIYTPIVNKPKIFSWKTCEIYKKFSNSQSYSQVQTSIDVEPKIEEVKEKSNINDQHRLTVSPINPSPPTMCVKKDYNLNQTKLSFGWEFQTDHNDSVAADTFSEDSFDEELSQMIFDQNTDNLVKENILFDEPCKKNCKIDKAVDLDESVLSQLDHGLNDDGHCTFNDGTLQDNESGSIGKFKWSNFTYSPIRNNESIDSNFKFVKSTPFIINNIKPSEEVDNKNYECLFANESLIPEVSHLPNEVYGDDLLSSQTDMFPGIIKHSKYCYDNENWDDLFDFIAQREIIKISKSIQAIVEE